MADRILTDNYLFADRARLASGEPMDHDRELMKELVRLYGSPKTDPAAKNATALATTLLLRAGRHATLVALANGELVLLIIIL